MSQHYLDPRVQELLYSAPEHRISLPGYDDSEHRTSLPGYDDSEFGDEDSDLDPDDDASTMEDDDPLAFLSYRDPAPRRGPFRLPRDRDPAKPVYEGWTVYIPRDEGDDANIHVAPTSHSQEQLADMYMAALNHHHAAHRDGAGCLLMRRFLRRAALRPTYDAKIDRLIRARGQTFQNELSYLLMDRGRHSSTPDRERVWTVALLQEQLCLRFASVKPTPARRHRVRWWKDNTRRQETEFFVVIVGRETRHDPDGVSLYTRFTNPWCYVDHENALRERDMSSKERREGFFAPPPPPARRPCRPFPCPVFIHRYAPSSVPWAPTAPRGPWAHAPPAPPSPPPWLSPPSQNCECEHLASPRAPSVFRMPSPPSPSSPPPPCAPVPYPGPPPTYRVMSTPPRHMFMPSYTFATPPPARPTPYQFCALPPVPRPAPYDAGFHNMPLPAWGLWPHPPPLPPHLGNSFIPHMPHSASWPPSPTSYHVSPTLPDYGPPPPPNAYSNLTTPASLGCVPMFCPVPQHPAAAAAAPISHSPPPPCSLWSGVRERQGSGVDSDATLAPDSFEAKSLAKDKPAGMLDG